MITVDAIRQRIDAIDDLSDDWEAAHREEDQLYRDVLQAIANGAPDPTHLARTALETSSLFFDRYYCARSG